MTTSPPALPALHAPVECSAALVPWRVPAGPRLTIVVKVAFAIGEGELDASHLLPAPPIHARDVHVQRSPLRSLEATSDLAPALPRAEVLLVGSAHATGGVATPASTVQLQVARGEVLLRKRAHVLGDRARHGEPPKPFRAMPIDWERSVKTDRNPIGVSASSRGANWIDPADPDREIGFGAIPTSWPARRQKRGQASVARLEGDVPELPAELDWTYFQCAPPDQQLERLFGDEWIALDGLHPVLPRLSFRLPQRRIAARFVDPSGRVLQTRDLAPDRLVIDVDKQRATLTHRGVLAADWSALQGYRIEVGSGSLGTEVIFADAEDPATQRGAVEIRAAAPVDLGATMSVDATRAAAPATPFRRTTDVPPPPPSRPFTFLEPQGSPGGPRPAAAGLPFTKPEEVAGPARGTVPLPLAPPAAPPDVGTRPSRGTVPFPPTVPGQPPPGASALPFPFQRPPPPPAPPPPLAVAPPLAAPPLAVAPPLAAPPLAVAPPGGSPRFLEPPPVPLEGEVPPAPAPAAPPKDEPRGDFVPTRTDGPLQVVTISWENRPPQTQLVVIVKASFALAHGKVSPLSPEPELPIGDIFADDDLEGPLVRASDFAPIKPKVDLLVMGHAHAPGGKTTAMQVAVRLKGAGVKYDRELAVFGDRTWQRALVAIAPSEPAPFEKLPISWARSFGGPGLGENPVGVGHKGAAGKDGLARLPNFELPGKLVRAPDDAPPPAGLGPLSPLWPARWSLVGTYDAAWFKSRWPHYAADLDPAYFQAAPPAQRLEQLRGDEEFELVGLHPTQGTVRGKLPCVRARAFVQKTQAAGGGFIEVALTLDTLTFQPDQDVGHLVWRGRLDVSDDDAPEIDEVFALAEPLTGPSLTLAEAKERHEKARRDPEEEPEPAREPEPPPPEDPDAEADAAAERAVHERIAAIEALTPPAPADPQPLPPLDPAAIARTLREAGAAEGEVAALLAAMTGTTEAEPPPGPPIDLRAFVKARIAAKEPLAKLDLRGADLRDLDLSGQSLAKSDLSRACLERADLSGADLSGAKLIATDLKSAKLTKGKLDAADLTRADFTGADLTGASLVDAEGEEVKLVDAVLRDAVLDEATLPRSDWTRADAAGVVATNLILTGSVLDRVRFAKAKLVALRLYDVRARDAVFDGADLTNARAGSAILTSCSFRDVAAKESVWERADLTTSTFQGADLGQAGMNRVVALKTNFNETDFASARFRKAKLTGATFVRANLIDVDFEKADLELADLRGANLHKAFFHRTVLKYAKTDHAIVTQSALGRR